MNETVFEKIEAAASVLKLDFSSEEFANFAEDQALSENAIDAVLSVLSYLSEKKQQTTIQTLLKMSRLPTKVPKTFENFDFSLLKGRDVERLKALPSLASIYSHRNLAFYWAGRHWENPFGAGIWLRLLPARDEDLFY